jgi:hypothetical protein
MPKSTKKAKSKRDKESFLSDRQKRALLIVLVVMLIAVPIVDNLRCKAACLKRIKTPYPEIACKYECPWPWQKGE